MIESNKTAFRRYERFFALFYIFLMSTGIASAQKWQEITTVEEICEAYPNEMKKMVGEFNLEYPGMGKVKAAWDSGNLTETCTRILEYYKKSDNALHLRKSQPVATKKTEAEADTILKNVFVIQNVRGQVPWGDDGHRDWYYKGPNNDREWAWLSNRHSQISQVFDVYMETGNPKYAEYIDLFLRDFIIKSFPYPGVKSSTSVWRGLEVHSRAKVWSRIFYGLLNSEYLTPATRLLILSSLPDHAHYNRNFHSQNNWLTMEISALATVATNFPEYKNAGEWLDYSIETMVESMKEQVYPDGVQTELTSHYHNVSLLNFVQFKEICDRADKTLPAFFNQTIEEMYRYIAHVVRPDGYRILNNDGDRGSDRQLILRGAEMYGKQDWVYIATNGNEGVKPDNGPSYFYPWAGHLVSRSGFDENAHWSFFDIGPWGSGHQHNDKLHISVAAYGRDLLVDAGRFAYTGEVAEKFRPYARGSQGHNVLLIDGKGQAPGPRLAEAPVPDSQWLIEDSYDYAWGSFDSFNELKGTCIHTRKLYYKRGAFWVVVDQLKTSRPRKVDALWHWHPECKVAVEGNQVFTKNKEGNLQVVPVGNREWRISLVEGQEEPEIQGWYSEEYNKYEPCVASIYTTQIEGDSQFVWVLYPSKNVEKGISSKIISESLKEIKVEIVNDKNEKWIVTVPL